MFARLETRFSYMMDSTMNKQKRGTKIMMHKDIMIIGGGQAGLALGYYLQQKNVSFAILDAGARTGDSWRNRYDSLKLFTPRRYSSLPGLSFPGQPDGVPTKEEAANYLELYAQVFHLPIIHNIRITSLEKTRNGFYMRCDQGREYTASKVVIATGPFQRPYIPPFSRQLNRDITQLHSSEYRNPEDMKPGSVLVVGAGNSGAQIAAELSRHHRVMLAAGHQLNYKPLSILTKSIFWYYQKFGLIEAGPDTRRGKWLKKQTDQVFVPELKELILRDRVLLKPRVADAGGETIRFQDGTRAEPQNIVWATGFRPDYSWIKIEGLLNKHGYPQHNRGVSTAAGLYYIGLQWQSCRGSALMGWVRKDAEYLANELIPS